VCHPFKRAPPLRLDSCASGRPAVSTTTRSRVIQTLLGLSIGALTVVKRNRADRDPEADSRSDAVASVRFRCARKAAQGPAGDARHRLVAARLRPCRPRAVDGTDGVGRPG
jgi:hypothetical protein